tara:strand:+ start:595 stop:810 length:216 start_codon:yes stop_codon:yes gene_type:complete
MTWRGRETAPFFMGQRYQMKNDLQKLSKKLAKKTPPAPKEKARPKNSTEWLQEAYSDTSNGAPKVGNVGYV